jgi:hypothetical protein
VEEPRLMPQILAPVGSMKGSSTDAPGAINYYVPVGGSDSAVGEGPADPAGAVRDHRPRAAVAGGIAAQNEIPNQVEAGKAIQALIERDSTARQAFLASLAEFHSRLMRRCLELFQEYADDKRTLSIRGHSGWEPIKDFKGAKLKDQIDVRVSPGSLVPMSRDAIQAKITAIASSSPATSRPRLPSPRWRTARARRSSDYENHVARANRIIQRIKDGTLMDMPTGPEPEGDGTPASARPRTGQPMQHPSPAGCRARSTASTSTSTSSSPS